MEKENWRVYLPSVDVPIFLLTFTMSILGTANSNLMMQRICYIILEHDKTQCEMLGNKNNNITKVLEEESQRVNTEIDLVRQSTEAVVTMVISLLIGPWSDRFGRRPGLILGMTGTFLTSCLGVVNASFELSPWYGLVFALPSVLTGGMFAFMIVASSYIMDITNVYNRGVRIAVFHAMMSAGGIGGTFLSSPLLKLFGYRNLNIAACVATGLALLFVIFGIKETLENTEKEGLIRGLFDWTNPKQMFITTFKRRVGANRGIILLITTVNTIGMFAMGGEMSLRTLYLRRKFGWVISQFTVYNGTSHIISVFGTVVGIWLMNRVFKTRESIACLVSYMLTMTASFLTGFATEDWHLYAVAGVRALDGTHAPLTTTLISKLVTQKEIAKVLSGMSGVKFLCGLFSSPLYTAIYNKTLSTNPGVYNFVSGGLFAVALLFLLAIVILEWHHPKVQECTEDEKQCDSNEKKISSIKSDKASLSSKLEISSL